MKNKYFKKICASVLIISLIFGLVPNTVGAEESTQNFTKELNDTTPEIITTTDGIQEGLELQEEPKVLGELESEREENVKHFLMSDRTVRAVMYSEPVHYYEDEEWKEIDPTLTLEEANDQDDFIGYINKKGNVTIKIAEKDTEKSLVKIQKDKYKIKFKFMKDQKEGYIEPKIAVVKEEETLNGLTSNSNSRNESSFQVDTVSDSIVYEGITDNETTDIEYKVTSTGLKENIIVRAKQDSYEYIFDIQTDYLELELKDNEIKAFDPQTGKVIYVIPAPFMYDANHKMSTDVIYSLEKNSTGYQLVVTGDKEWINAEDTVFPVTIDPVITTETTKEAISSTFVSSGMPSTNFFDYKMLLVGLETSSYNKTRTLIKIQLPELGQGDIVQSAYLNLLQYDISSFTTSNPDMPINAYEVTSSWNESTVTWNTMPSYDSRKLDYNYISRTDGIETKTFDITKAAKEWYDGDTSNFGIILRADKETGDYAEVAMNARYWSEKYNEETDAYPIIILEYRNSKGMEDYYSYTDLDAGSAGNAYINNYTGNLYFAQAGVVTGGLKMPASVYLTYNTSALNDDSANLKLKSGYGWKLNVQQYVISSSNRGLSSEAQQTYPYVYVDGDGTDHYFMKVVNGTTTTYIDEDGLGLELSKDTSTGYYTIRDKNDTVMTFRDNGNLISVIDSNGNTITVNYDTSGTLIQSVTDGAGKQISINYTNEYLSSIIDPAGRAINYTIDVGGSTETIDDKLTKVTYPDSTLINYTYDEDNTLSNIKSSDGYELDFTYLPKAAGKRISKVTEHAYHTDGTKETGQSIGFDYSKHNTTIIKTSGQDNQYGTADDLNTVYQFDNYGRLISTQANVNGKQLGTSLTKYTSGQADVTGSNIKQLNRVSSSISYGANVNNLLKNHNVESSDIWQLIKTGTANEVAGYTSVEKYIGNQSLKISVTGAASGSNVRYRQMLTNDVVKPGNTYTFSGYIKTTELNPLVKDSFGAALLVYSYFADGSVKAFYSDNISSTNDEEINDGWRRESVTFTVPAGTVETSVNLVLRNANGNAYFDSLQLEEGSTANSYNLLENASFENETNLYGYTSTDLTLGTTVDMPVQDSIDGNWGFRVVGDAQKSKKLSQEVNVSGSEEDTYIVSGWAKAFAVPELIQNDIESKYRKFKISVKVTYSDGTSLWKSTAEFNPSVLDWQYSAVTINLSDNDSATNKTPSKISIYLRYEYQANEVIFDNLSIIKDSVPSYTYDLDGNLISVTDNAKQKSSMTYSNQNLISSTDAKGYDYQYTYDTKHNMTQAKSQRGVTYNYTYHSSGNPTKLVIQNMESSAYDWKIQTDMTYTPDGAYVNTVSDQDGYVTTTSYDADKGLLDSVTDAKGNTIQYTYDNDNDSLTQVSGTVGGQEVANSYEYNKKLLSRITHNGFSYNLLYDVFGNSTNVKVGNVSLITYGYKAGNGDLDIITYGNGDTNTYQYDIYGNVSELAVDGNVRYKWSADNAGNVIKHEDLRNALIYNYEYDTTGRLIRQDVMDTSKPVTSQRNAYLLEYGYDLNNNVTKFITKAGSRTLTNTYEYTKDNLPTKYTMPTGKTVTYSYDSLNRMNQYITSTTAPITVGYTYVLSKRNEAGQNNYRTTKIEAETVGNLGTKYSYDELGNITEIYEKATDGSYVLTNSYEYDELSQLVRENDANQNLSKVYTYDLGGNIISIKEYAYTTEALGEVLNTTSYEYTDTNWKDKLTAYNGQSITYDEIGNPISYNGYTLGWDNGRELTTLSGNGVTAAYSYDADGLRASKIVNGTTTTYEYVNGKLLYEKKGDIELHYFYDASGVLKGIQTVDGSNNVATYYVVTNTRGDVTKIYDEAGILQVLYTYDAWGKILGIKDAGGNGIVSETHIGRLNSLRYRGYYYDTETGLFYVGSRYYNPEWGRFINADDSYVLQYDQDNVLQSNLFTYCLNNPVNMIDPDGHASMRALESMFSFSEVRYLLEAIGVAIISLPISTLLLIAGGAAVVVGGTYICLKSKAKPKSSNLPSFKKLTLDKNHIISGHGGDGKRGGPNKDRFPKWMTWSMMQKAIEEAYNTSKKLQTQGDRVFLSGYSKTYNTVVQMWVNLKDKIIESAWPK